MAALSTTDSAPLTLREVELRAKENLPSHIYEFYASGSDDEEALRRNVEAFGRLCIRPRVLVDVSRVDTSTELFGWKTALPIGIAPSAMQKLAGGDGELDVVKAAAGMCINMTLSSQSTTSLEDVQRARESVTAETQVQAPPLWMQLYLYEDMQKSTQLIRRAEKSSYEALVLTVDTPVLGNRLAERKTAVVLPPGMSLPNTTASSPQSSSPNLLPSVNRLLMNARTAADAQALRQASGSVMHSSSMTWAKSLAFLRRVTKMRIILKGIMTGEDAALAVQHGADAIIVSNHGGRQLSSTCATIEALPEIVAAVQGRIPIILDGGVRTGADVFKALALGADFICVGRPALWGLAYDGQKGVEAVIHILERELSRTMTLAGVSRIKDISRDRLGIVARDTFGISKL
ncbi:FMN-dependent dehydrogenase [Microdochium trichocladiopsis]|uniref:FMN-dependent dehydrogenase n=1 Tax=Microdochium trichocladiopsis TaxID=1682393 RepID=A0A9P9BSF8_9PEZI|nr:FMN-dependent dehydrogenase [Microdochium trichocladiopsis]KAH7034529.1 FMN-dependent dehydrogenase [Microdochium trichocladiopsis]